MKHTEFKIQSQFCRWLKFAHPDLMFLSDTVANIRLTFSQQARNKDIQCQRFKCPDVIILEPNSKYHGLLLEFKRESPFLKKYPTQLKMDLHVHGQKDSIDKLNDKGYYAQFVWSFDMAVEIVEKYLKNEL